MTQLDNSIRAVLFDLDGTLLETLEDLATSVNAVLSAHGWPGHGTDEYRHFVGEGVEELVRRAAPPGVDAATSRTLVDEMRAQYQQRWAVRTAPYPGVPELLDGLAQRGLEMAVLSNKLEEFTRRMVAHFFSRWTFAAVVGASSRFPKKPDPAAALAIARELGVDPSQFLYLGDTGIDMRTAVGAGMRAVGALWGFRDADELRQAGARELIASPLEVLRLIDGRPSHLAAR